MKRKASSLFSEHWLLLTFLFLYAAFVSYFLIAKPTPFFDWDEAIYAQVGREMMRQKSFFVPLWQGIPWLDKPPVPSLFYGLVELLPVAPEISARLATLMLSLIALVLLYLLTYRLTKHKIAALLAVIITAFLPGFYQRSQVLNVDVFLLIGWLGYIIWYERFWTATFFLLLSVLSKSLLGYYPPLLFLAYHTYELLVRQINHKQYAALLKKIGAQLLIVSLWFIGMTIYYGYPFIQYQFIDSHFKRVAASIEQHFGQRTFYIDTLVEQLKWLVIPAAAATCFLIYRFFRGKNAEKKQAFLLLFFVPWFFFLNLTKTKIAWYLYPTLPQFALLAAYPLVLLRKKPALTAVISIAVLMAFFAYVVPVSSIVTGSYSRWEDHQRIALAAKKQGCKTLAVLVDETTRTSYATLKSMDLVISTTTWWGSHPSIAYYADTKTTYLYKVPELTARIAGTPAGSCFIATKQDYDAMASVHSLSVPAQNQTFVLLQK